MQIIKGKNIKRPPDWHHLPHSTIKADQKKSDRLCQRCLADLKQKKDSLLVFEDLISSIKRFHGGMTNFVDICSECK